jgi:predicted transcriptional regulator
MGAQVLNVPVDDYTVERLAEVAKSRNVGLEALAAEAFFLFLAMEEQPSESYVWTEEDLKAIQQGLDQLDRGEGVDQSVVEHEIDELLRS